VGVSSCRGAKHAEELNARHATVRTNSYTVQQSDPTCEMRLLSDPGSDYLKLRMMSGSTLVYESHDLGVSELEKMSEGKLWNLLEHLSSRRIRCPAA